MQPLSEQVHQLSTRITNDLHFANHDELTQEMLLQTALRDHPAARQAFEPYTLLLDVQETNAVILVCEDNHALLEDAGCNKNFDRHHWQSIPLPTCEFTLNTLDLCE
ncbi:hypothetical protein [Thaumasiovibrio subtropicus]|nr:hypothetical protein [Thaumasiovibrio subtropicus]